LPVIDLSKLDNDTVKKLESSLDRLAKRDLGTIFEEMQAKDHRALDGIVFDALGLTPRERSEIYSALRDLVTERIVKAKSVKRNGNNHGRKKKNDENGGAFPPSQQTLFDFVF